MPTRPLSDEALMEAVQLRQRHPNSDEAAKVLGISRGAFDNRLRRAAERGLMGPTEALPGYAIKSISTQRGPDGETQREWVQQTKAAGESFVLPEGHSVKGVSALVDGTGRTLAQWIKTKAEADPLDIVATIREAFADYAPAVDPISRPVRTNGDFLTLYPLADWHIGLHAWNGNASTNWDLKLAENAIGQGIADLIERSPASAHCVVLGGGDLLHGDNMDNRTARSGHALDVDGRWPKILMAASRLLVRTIDAALERHDHVTVRILRGNHDDHSAIAVAYFLLAWYRNEPRVTVDPDASLFFWHRFGRVMLGATHGHTVKLQDMPQIMAHRRAEDWGQTRHRYVHGFHLHHKRVLATEGGGVVAEIHQTPTPQDAWHYGAGFLSGRSMQAITYHKDFGEVSRTRAAFFDAELA